jgi:hypothetical protein
LIWQLAFGLGVLVKTVCAGEVAKEVKKIAN